MRTSIWVYGGLLAGLLVASYFRWTGVLGKAVETKDILVFDTTVDELERIVYHEDKLDVVVDVKKDAVGTYAWVGVEERKPIPKKDEPAKAETPAGEAAEAAAEEGKKEEPPKAEEPAKAGEPPKAEEFEVSKSTFKGGDAADKLLAAFGPLKAVQRLEGLTDEKKTELELATPTAWFEITRKGKTRKFELGGESYGTKDRYVRDVENDKYYLIKADTIRPLKYAKTRLPDRRLLGLEAKDVARARLEGPTGGVDMLHQNREDEKAAYWSNPEKPDQKVEMYENWLDKALKLRGLSYVQPEDQPGELTPVFKLTVSGDAGKTETLEMLQSTDDKGEVQYFCRSDFTRGLMKVHKTLVQEVADDVKSVIDAQPGDVVPESSKPAVRVGPDGRPMPPRPPLPVPPPRE